jgi:hypothetical protein
MRTDARGKRRASGCGTAWGAKPADKALLFRARSEADAPPLRPMLMRKTRVRSVVRADGRNWLIRPTQNGMMPAWLSFLADQESFTVHPAYSEQLRVAVTSGIGTGELSRRRTRFGGLENARGRRRGRRRRSSQMPGCNGPDTVKVRQGRSVEEQANGHRGESR